VFLHGLAPYMKDELASRDIPSTLDGVIKLATRVDSRIQDRRRERRHETFTHLPSVIHRGSPPLLQSCNQGGRTYAAWPYQSLAV